jgi:NADPH-dependent 2,4-dienoyl-CoA reductase/sulfur reductase-like enzyme
MSQIERIVVVGAGLAGLRAGERLRELGFNGELLMIGDESLPPYHRPALSKQLLTGAMHANDLLLPAYRDIGAVWRLGTPAGYLLPRSHIVRLPGGEEIKYDGLVIATGVEARRPGGAPYQDPRVLVMRTLPDALNLERAIASSRGPVAVIGGGFTGCEIAASLRHMGREVTLIGRQPNLLGNVLGPALGEWLTNLHRGHGVDLALENSVKQWVPQADGIALHLADGSSMLAACVVIAAGSVPSTNWLRGSGLPLDDGVVCEATCHVVGADDVVAAGDVAQWPNLRFDDVPRRIEHWLNAVEMGRAAAESLLAGRSSARPFTPMPRFWTEHYGKRIMAAGVPKLGKDTVTLGSPDDGTGNVTGYVRDGRLMGVVGVDCPKAVLSWTESVCQQNPVPRTDNEPQESAPRAPAEPAFRKGNNGRHALPAATKRKRSDVAVESNPGMQPVELGALASNPDMVPFDVNGFAGPGTHGQVPAVNGHGPGTNGRIPPVNGFAGPGPGGRMAPVNGHPGTNGRIPPVNGFAGPGTNGQMPAVNGHPGTNGRIPPVHGHPGTNGRIPPVNGFAGPGTNGQMPAVNGHPGTNGRIPPVHGHPGTNGRIPPVNGHAASGTNGRIPPVNGHAGTNGRIPPVNGFAGPGTNGRMPMVNGLSGTNGRIPPVNGHPGTNGRIPPVNGHPGTNGRIPPVNGFAGPGTNGRMPMVNGLSGTNGRIPPVNGHPGTNGRIPPVNGFAGPGTNGRIPPVNGFAGPGTNGRIPPVNGHAGPVDGRGPVSRHAGPGADRRVGPVNGSGADGRMAPFETRGQERLFDTSGRLAPVRDHARHVETSARLNGHSVPGANGNAVGARRAAWVEDLEMTGQVMPVEYGRWIAEANGRRNW